MSDFKLMDNQLKPREKLKVSGSNSLSDAELLAIILQTGSKNQSVIQLSLNLIESSGGLENLFDLSYNELIEYKAVGDAKAIKLLSISEINKRINKEKVRKEVKEIKTSKDIFLNLKCDFSIKQEKLFLVSLNTKNEIISILEIYKGTLNTISIHPREIFMEAIKSGAHKIILAHNHPSRNLTPSENDIEVTKRILAISQIMGIELIDHIIFSDTEYLSMFEKNYI